MAFRALLFSKSPETNAAMTTACESTGIRAEVHSDIFSAIEKAKTRAFSCVITDWADQPEASFLLKRARESALNHETVGIAIVDNEPTAAEMRDNRLDFLIYRPISAQEADAVLAKACEQMKSSGIDDLAEPPKEPSASASDPGATESQEVSAPEDYDQGGTAAEEPLLPHRSNSRELGLREVFAAVLILAAAFCLWKSRASIVYLAHTPEGRVRVLRESAAALFYVNQTGALPVGAAGGDAEQDAYFSRGPVTTSNSQAPALEVAATESTLPEMRIPLPKPSDFPLPVATFVPPVTPPIRPLHVEIPESMRNSPPMSPPVTVNPAQMLPVSAPQLQPAIQQFTEPVPVSEAAARALLVHTVNPVYPSEGFAQKLHGAVVLQALVGRDGSVQDLKIVRGYFILGRAAIDAVKQWRFQPYNINGHAAATQTQITINFNYPPG